MESIVNKVREDMPVDGDSNTRRAHLCVVCDCIIIGLDEVRFIDKLRLLYYADHLCVLVYQEYYDRVVLYS